jgi:hypothetical protein
MRNHKEFFGSRRRHGGDLMRHHTEVTPQGC